MGLTIATSLAGLTNFSVNSISSLSSTPFILLSNSSDKEVLNIAGSKGDFIGDIVIFMASRLASTMLLDTSGGGLGDFKKLVGNAGKIPMVELNFEGVAAVTKNDLFVC